MYDMPEVIIQEEQGKTSQDEHPKFPCMTSPIATFAVVTTFNLIANARVTIRHQKTPFVPNCLGT